MGLYFNEKYNTLMLRDKYDPLNYLHIKENDMLGYKDYTKEFLIDEVEDENKTKDEEIDLIDLMIRNSVDKTKFIKIDNLDLISKQANLNTLENTYWFNLNCIIYFKIDDIYYVNTIAQNETNIYEKNRIMFNMFNFMYQISKRNHNLIFKLMKYVNSK